MSTGIKRNMEKLQGRRILWINPAPLDVFLHQASSLEILRYMAKKGYCSVLITTRSKGVVQFENPRVRIISVPLRFVPLLSSVMFAFGLILFLPFYLTAIEPNFVIVTQPEASILGFIPNLLFSKIRRLDLF